MTIADKLKKKAKRFVNALSELRKRIETGADEIDINQLMIDDSKANRLEMASNLEKEEPVFQIESDSPDANVFVSYMNQPCKGWECLDCGTVNVFWVNYCEVCGFIQR